MASQDLNFALLRPAILHILRAAGFHSARPSVIDTVTDLCARYLLLVASKTADFAYERTSSSNDHELDKPPERSSDELPIPNISDIRHALTSVSFFMGSMTASEEDWHEVLRKPLSAYTVGAREKERQRRDEDDTQDVREFVDWATGPQAREIRRIAGLLKDKGVSIPPPVTIAEQDAIHSDQDLEKLERDDYLSALKKKHSKTGDGARYAGTVLGRTAVEERPALKIEGGPANLSAWREELKRKQVDEAAKASSSNKRTHLSS